MMEINQETIEQMKKENNDFIGAAGIAWSMFMSHYYGVEEDKAVLDSLVLVSGDNLALPRFGRKGNAIALALELNHYVTAKYLLDNARKFNLRTDVVSYGLEGDMRSLKEEYLYSQILHDKSHRPRLEGETKEQYLTYFDFWARNNAANKDLAYVLSLTDEEREKFGLEEELNRK